MDMAWAGDISVCAQLRKSKYYPGNPIYAVMNDEGIEGNVKEHSL